MMYNDVEKVKVKQITMDVVTQAVQRHVDSLDLPLTNYRVNVDFVPMLEQMTEHMVVTLTRRIPREQLDVINIDFQVSYPANWWEAVKERFAPKWFLKRYPVKYETKGVKESYSVDAFYDKVSIPEYEPVVRFTKMDVPPVARDW